VEEGGFERDIRVPFCLRCLFGMMDGA
jgi:hypothetical protein